MTDYTIKIPLSKTGKHAGKYTTIVDVVDADLSELNWQVQIVSTGRTPYATRGVKVKGNGKTLLMHRIILARMLDRALLPNEYVDHIDDNGLNNQRRNLRVATNAQNMANAGKHKNNTSGYKGVSFHKPTGKWMARIRANHKRIYLGCFASPKEAHAAYCAAAKIYHGDFANNG